MSALVTAKEYFDLSNARDLEGIANIFAEDATYSSDNTGLYYGKNDIMTMINGFFSSFSELNWVVHSIEEKTPHIVEMDFTFTGKDQNGSDVERRGLESLIIVDGKIRHIEMRNR